jgi:hypothetical protein
MDHTLDMKALARFDASAIVAGCVWLTAGVGDFGFTLLYLWAVVSAKARTTRIVPSRVAIALSTGDPTNGKIAGQVAFVPAQAAPILGCFWIASWSTE